MAQMNGHLECHPVRHDENGNKTNINGINDTNCTSHNSSNNENSRVGFEPIAICGMSCRLPGGISSPNDLWTALMERRDARSRVPATRFNIDGYYSATNKPGTTDCKFGYFLDESVDLAGLDTSFFSMSRLDVEWLDPQQRIMLEVARECLDDAGEIGFQGANIGVYMGSFANDWYDIMSRDPLHRSIVSSLASHDFMISERVSHEMDLRGPSMTIRTACSSALIGLNEACAAIGKGDCESAIVGGTSLILAPDLVTRLADQNILSPDGSCKTFSAEANGYARAEAVVSVFVKSLSAAIRDRNPIRSIISGSAANFDGKTNPMTSPSASAQESLIRRAYKIAGISDVHKTAVFECHGTGTATGDPIETEAIASVFGDQGIYLGSLKPNLGHSEGASGLTAVLKATLTLEHKTIAPNIKYSPLNPNIPFERAKLRIPEEPTEWPVGCDERISINSFGVGGSNAHVILESPACFASRHHTPVPGDTTSVTEEDEQPQLLLFSAKTALSLEGMVTNYQTLHDNGFPMKLSDLAYTLSNRREHFSHRSFAVATKDCIEFPAAISPTKDGKSAPISLVMVFSGQGAVWPQMGRELLLTNTTFANTIQILQNHLQSLGSAAPKWSLSEELLKPARTSRVYEAEFSQTISTALQIGLVDIFGAIGVKPAAVVGHSSGEIAGAYAAGALTAKEAIIVAYLRGAAVTETGQQGAMAAVALSWLETEKFLIPGALIACDNSQNSVTLSGDVDSLEKVVAEIKHAHPGIAATTLKVDKAYHSHHMLRVGDRYYKAMIDAGVLGREPSIPFFSSVTGSRLVKSKVIQLGPQYWQTNLERPVLFRSAISTILKSKDLSKIAFLEVGPHSALAGPLRQVMAAESSKASYISTLVRRQNSAESVLQAIGKLYTLHVNIDFNTLVPSGSCIAGLPRYPWNHHKRLFFESRLAKEWRERKYPEHSLLGIKIDESTSFEPAWRNLLQVSRTPWLLDHKIEDTIVFPFAGYVSIAAEACRQVTGIQDGVSLRDVTVSNALVIENEGGTEIVTTMRRARLTDEQDSEWWEFSVSSHNGHIWTKHCRGEVRGEPGAPPSEQNAQRKVGLLPRRLDASKWYDHAREGGLTYGPSFNTLEVVRTSTKAPCQATATIQNKNSGWEDVSEYHMHPAVLDTFYQLISYTSTLGILRARRRLLASGIEFMTLFRCTDDTLDMEVTSELTGKDLIGSGTIFAGSKPIVRIVNSHSSFFDETEAQGETSAPITARCEWTPHIDFKPLSELVMPASQEQLSSIILAELTRLAIAIANGSVGAIDATTPHLIKYKHWLMKSVDVNLAKSDIAALRRDFESLYLKLEEVGSPFAQNAGLSIRAISNYIEDLFLGRTTGFDILNTHASPELDVAPPVDHSRFLKCLGNTKPNLRVLEFASGLGLSTLKNVQSLLRDDGRLCYSRYVVASTSLGVLEIMKEKLSNISASMEFVQLNLSEEMSDQGFENRQFDLIIANGVVTASSHIREALRKLKVLLSPGGRLILEEPKPDISWAKFVLGTMENWWSHSTDQRTEEPFIDLTRWQMDFTASGLAKLEYLDLGPWSSNVLVAKLEDNTDLERRMTLLCNDDQTVSLIAELESHGYRFDRCSLKQIPPQGQDILALLDEKSSFVENMDMDTFSQFKSFVRNLDGSSGLLWVTKLSSIGCSDPRYAQVIGLARTLRNELEIDFATCEVDDISSPTGVGNLIKVIHKFQNRREDGLLGPDYEYAIYNDQILVNRISPFSIEKELLVTDQSNEAFVTITQLRRLETLTWSSQPGTAPEDDEVEVEVYASGMNLRYVLVAMGIIPAAKGLRFGYEAAGVVRRVGSKVAKFHVGDRIVVFGSDTLSTVVRIPEILCKRLPDHISFVQGATIPVVFLTAVYGLIDLGHLTKDQSVLIHSGCGGVGLAAIQVALMQGAEVYTTVGNDSKAEYLMKTFHIPRNRIFNSRDVSFADDLLRETDGKGVDVALNSLSGELLHATWKCVAKWGTMVEIGKRDLVENGKLDMNHFLESRSYCCLDIDQMRSERPGIADRLLQFIMECFDKGLLKAIPLDQVFPGSAVLDAFRYMQQGKHIGKIVLEIRDLTGKPLLEDISFTKKPDLQLDSTASYLLIGGLGGLGRAISVWMAERGAKSLTYLSRSAGSGPNDGDFRLEMESMGCSVQMVRGDVTNPDDVARAIDGVVAPLKGIVQMSMVLRDHMFEDMTFDQWNAAVRPKVQGTWNLHETVLSRRLELDFFVLFSSLSGVLGQIGQANYASANTFLDAFSQYRSSMGLPCTSLVLGAMEGIGYLEQNQDLLRKMKGTGWRSVKEIELVEALSLAMLPNSSRKRHGDTFILGVAPTVSLSSTESSSRLRKDVRMAIYHNMGHSNAESSPGTDCLRSFLALAKKDPSTFDSQDAVSLLAVEIGKKLASLLLIGDLELDITMSTSALGLDSLIAFELRSWWKVTFGFEISTLELLSLGTLEALGKRAADELKVLYAM